jgi:hypothetical protein
MFYIRWLRRAHRPGMSARSGVTQTLSWFHDRRNFRLPVTTKGYCANFEPGSETMKLHPALFKRIKGVQLFIL